MTFSYFSFRNVKRRAETLNKSKAKPRTVEECFEEVLGDSINHHLEILELAARMEELCSMIVLVIFLSGVLQLCFMLYQASVVRTRMRNREKHERKRFFFSFWQVPVGSSQFMQNMFYWCDIAVQVLIYCYFGDEVTEEAANVSKAITEMDWTDASKSSRKALVLVIARSQKPLYMTAGGFVPLSLPIFMSVTISVRKNEKKNKRIENIFNLQIVKGSFSYFMVFRQVSDEASEN